MVPGEGTGRTEGSGVAARAWMARRRRPGRVHAARITSGRPRTAGGSETRGLPHSDPRNRRSALVGIRSPSGTAAVRTTVGPMRYPDAPRLDLVEDLHGHAVADPYRWLEDAADPRTAGVDRGPGRARRRGRSTRCRCATEFAARLEQLVHAGAVGVPVWRGGRAFSTRRDPGQEHARPAGPRGRRHASACCVDPMALDPAGTTTLDAWSPSWRATGWPTSSPPAATRSRSSTCSTSPPARSSTGRSTAAATPPSPGCPAARSCSTCAGSPRTQVPAGEEQFHRRVWRHRVGAPGRRRRPGARRGQRPDHLLRRAHQPRRPLAGRLRLRRHRAARRRLDRRPRRRRRAARASRSASTRRPPRGWPATAGCG